MVLMICLAAQVVFAFIMFSMPVPKSITGAEYTAYVTIAITGFANLYFGYRVTRENHIEEMLRKVKRFAKDTGAGHRVIRGELALLSRIGWACILVSLVSPVLNTPLTVQGYRRWGSPEWRSSTKLLHLLILNVTSVVFLATLVYLAALFIWTTHCYWRCAKHFIDGTTIATVAEKAASRELFNLLAQMRKTSDEWSVNNAVRFVSAVIVASSILVIAQIVHEKEHVSMRVICTYAWSMIEYFIVWVSATGVGVVSDKIWGALARKMCELGNQEHALESGPVRETPVVLMQRVGQSKGAGYGLHFASVRMSTASAITVGGFLFALMQFSVQQATAL